MSQAHYLNLKTLLSYLGYTRPFMARTVQVAGDSSPKTMSEDQKTALSTWEVLAMH